MRFATLVVVVGLIGCAESPTTVRLATTGSTMCFAGTGETMERRPPNPPGALFNYRTIVKRRLDPATGAIDEVRTREDGERPPHVDEHWSIRPTGDRFELAIAEAVIRGSTTRDAGGWQFIGAEITIEESLEGDTLDTHYQERDADRALRAERRERLAAIDCAQYGAQRAQIAATR